MTDQKESGKNPSDNNVAETTLLQCDLVMKGGITSGVVYPAAVHKLSKKYEFQNIGGTSAGAIATVMTAAAEYHRKTHKNRDGFEKLKDVSRDFANGLLQFFQPTQKLKPLFNVILAIMRGGKILIYLSLLWNYKSYSFHGILLGSLIVACGCLKTNCSVVILGLAVMFILSAALAMRGCYISITRDLPKSGFGICPGVQQPESETEALSDWITNTIDDLADFKENLLIDEGCLGETIKEFEKFNDFSDEKNYKKPLTIGDLAKHGINVATVTTDITTGRPYKLPMDNNDHFFSCREFLKYFPMRVVLHMCMTSSPVNRKGVNNPDGDLYYFQNKEDLPLVVLARMSLSFPILFTTVPLHRIDYTIKDEEKRKDPVKCHFSDGGISSNFPVHFFDAFLPKTPTFGISLNEYDEERHTKKINLPIKSKKGQALSTKPFEGISGFLMALFNSAKDWQDSLQSILTGYRDRIVTISLEEDEGGLNFEMPESTIKKLEGYGAEAGKEIIDNFKIDEHKWRRMLVEMNALEAMLVSFSENYYVAPTKGSSSYHDIAVPPPPSASSLNQPFVNQSFLNITKKKRIQIKKRMETLAILGKAWKKQPNLNDDPNMPKTRSSIRNIANMGD